MTESTDPNPRPADTAGRVLLVLSSALALLGGIVLCAMAALTTLSVSGRAFLNAPITGDFELIAIGTGVAVFAFLPYCQMRRENVVVDFFMAGAPARVRTALDAVGSLAYGLIIALMSWRTTLGGIDMFEANETTMILGVQRWWTFPFAVLCLLLLLAVCVYSLARDLRGLRLGRQG